jgi:hypothetical protein
VTTKGGRHFVAKLVGRDPGTDVAVLRIRDAAGLLAIPMGDSDALQEGLARRATHLKSVQTCFAAFVFRLKTTGAGRCRNPAVLLSLEARRTQDNHRSASASRRLAANILHSRIAHRLRPLNFLPTVG